MSINRSLESQTIAEGGRAGDVKILTDLITPENLKDAISRNINNILLFANGRSTELTFYIPVNKIPEPLLSTNLIKVKSQMTLTELIKEFNIQGISAYQIQSASRLGTASWIIFSLGAFLIVLLLFLLYLLTDLGKRLTTPGIALVLSGLVALIVTGAGTAIRINWTKDLAGSTNVGDSVIGIVTPPVIQSVLNVWLYAAVFSIVIGLILFFVKKPGYN